ncbi:putative RNA-directed DNA polymerase from mobile element jockey-like [Apostichopus japonicus]|uniref:Putative RNA-directed DNA polymerase from mobile element jockey-like n=1 Tax=Stichopus japonicus TaxID=307972 RepID=A0A2G8KLY8_STIJA|nr:putative RNA-directed DNA polymerase from mobile element jockey-like [Apostichopus japonicus]
MSLSNHSLPSDWKVAYVAPLFKKGSRSSPANYRPVSLTSVVCKVCESLLRDSVVAHMNRNNLFSTGQYGFISGKSCVTQLIDVLDDWTKSLDDGSGIDVVYTDFMKAFDKVPHERLLAKVRSYGITGDLLQWIRQFLYRRKQRVCVEGSLSDWADITSGIPQGSVLGPILFLLYINDLPSSIAGCSVKIFADDTKLYKAVHSLRDCDVLQNNIDNMYNWSVTWQLHFHPDKCHVLRVGCSYLEYHYTMPKYDGGSQSLEVVNSERALGVVVDNGLNFREHVASIVSKANSILGIIRRTFRYLDRDTVLLLYIGLSETSFGVWSASLVTYLSSGIRGYRICATQSN